MIFLRTSDGIVGTVERKKGFGAWDAEMSDVVRIALKNDRSPKRQTLITHITHFYPEWRYAGHWQYRRRKLRCIVMLTPENLIIKNHLHPEISFCISPSEVIRNIIQPGIFSTHTVGIVYLYRQCFLWR